MGDHPDVRWMQIIENLLRPMFIALPKLLHSLLDPPTVRYALLRYVSDQYSWYFKGVERRSDVTDPPSKTIVLKGKMTVSETDHEQTEGLFLLINQFSDQRI